MAVQGIFASNQNIVGSRSGDFADAILKLNPTGSAPLLALTSGMPSEGATDAAVNWFEEVKITGRVAVVSGGTATTVVVADGSSFTEGVILETEASGEIMMVTAVSGNSLTVVRGMSGTTNTSVSGSDFLTRVGNAHEEGSSIPTAVVNQGFARINYCQIFRNSWAVTGTTNAITFRTGKVKSKSKLDASFFHAEDMERAFLWGKKHQGVLNGKPLRLMDGVVSQIENYGGEVEAESTSTTMAEWRDFMRRVFKDNIKGQPNERIGFSGDLGLQVLVESARKDGQFEITVNDTQFGIKVTEFVSPFGVLKLMTHPLMNENASRQRNVLVLHPGGIKVRKLRNTNHEGYDTDGKRIAGADADQGVITSELCIQVMAASTMGHFTGLTTSAASA